MKLRELKDKRAATYDKMEAIMEKAKKENRDLTPEEAEEYDKLDKELESQADQVRRAESYEKRQAEMAMNEGKKLHTGGTDGQATREEKKNLRGWLPEHREIKVTSNAEDRFLKDRQEDEILLGTYLRWQVNGPANEVEQRALNSLDAGTAKNTVPAPVASQLIDLNRNATVIGRSGATYITLDTNNYAIPKMTGDVSAAWRDESETINPGDPTFTKVPFKVKNLGGLVRVAAELFADNTVGLDRQLMRAFTEKFALEFDESILYGDGVKKPLGVSTFAGAQTIDKGANGGTITDYTDIVRAYRLLMDANYDGPTSAIMAPREWETFTNLVDANNNPLMMPRGIQGLPWLTTKSMPVSLDAGTAGSVGSQVFLGDFRELVVAIRQDIEMRVLSETFAQTNEIGILCTMRGDAQPLKEDAFVIIDHVITA